MDMPEVKSFNAELSGLYDNKPPISKAKMSAITKGAIKAIKFYKHVVHSVEKFIQKCKPEYKVPGLYVIDSIVRQSRHQFGQDKDVFAPRFAKNMQQTFANLFRCPQEDKRNIIRVLNLWQKNNVFSSEVIQPLLDMADPNHPLHQEIQQQNNTANGSSLNVSHNTSENKISPVPPPQHTPHASTPMGDQFQDQPSGTAPGVKFNRKLLNDFEYESEDDSAPADPPPPAPAQNPTDALGSILTNPEIMRQLQSLQAQMQLMTGMQIPNLMPMMTDMQLQQSQSQNPYLSSQQDQQKQGEGKDDMANESDIEFVETGPQVIEIPDANDSRSPSPKSRRHRSRSKSPKRRRRSRTRSRSPRRRRDRDRERDRDRDRDREKSYKDREAEREKQKEREKKGLPPIKKENLSVCSTTLWVGHLSKLATQEELSDLFGAIGGVVSIDVVAPRGCAFVVMERRRDAHKAHNKLNKHKLHSKEITVAWAPGKGVKGREWKDYWEADLGVSYLPWAALHARWSMGALSLDALEDGGAVDEETLPPWLPPRIIPKIMDSMPLMPVMPPPGPGMMPNIPPGGIPALQTGNLPPGNMPGNLQPGNMPPAGLPSGVPPGNLMPSIPTSAPPGNLPMAVPRMPPPGMTAGIPPGMAPGMPPGIRPPSIPTGVPGLQTDASLPPTGPLLGFPPTMPPQSIPQPGGGVMGGFLGGLLGVGGLVAGVPLQLQHHGPPHHLHHHHHQQQHQQHPPALPRTTEVSQADDAMDLDTEDTHEDSSHDTQTDTSSVPPPLLSDQLQALLSKPPPNFNASEPPPGFNVSEPPPFNVNQPPPKTEEKQEEERKSDRDRDRRDRDRRDRERDNRDRRDRSDRDRRERERGGRDRERADRGEDRRDRDRDRGRERRDRDRDRDRERFSSRDNNRERSREKSPRSANQEQNNEKSLQERLWEMANGKPARSEGDKPREEYQENLPREETRLEDIRPPPLIDRLPIRHDLPPPLLDGEGEKGAEPEGGWTQIPPTRHPPPHMAPAFRAELRMRGPPRQPMRGPWMDGPGPGPGPGPFGPRFNGMGPPFNRPPFERPPFEGGPPLFDGPPRFERPPFNRMPFDNMARPPFDGPRPPFDGPRPPFDGPRPPFDGPRPPFDGPRPPFDGPPRQFDGPPFEGDRPFDGPRFDGPPEFFDRNNRRFDDREQFNDRGWNGDRDRDREWDRRNEWDDRRRDRRSRDHDDRFRDRNDRRRHFDDRRPPRDDRNPGRDDRNPPRDDKNNTPKDSKAPPRDEKAKDERNTRRDKDRKSRWGAAEESTNQNEEEIVQKQIENDRNEENIEIAGNENTGDDSSHVEQNVQNTGNEESVPDIQNRERIEAFDGNEQDRENTNSNYDSQENYQSNYDNEESNIGNYDNQDRGETNYEPEKNVVSYDNPESNETSYNKDENTVSNSDSQENDINNYTNEEKQESFTESRDSYQSNNEITTNDIDTALYDAGEAVDTSFSMPAEINFETPAPEKEAVWEPNEFKPSEDIFCQLESKLETQEGNSEAQSTAENKEGIA